MRTIEGTTYLIIGALLFFGSAWLLNYMQDIWLFDVNRLDLLRAVAQGRADSHSLLEAALPEVIWAFLGAITAGVAGLCLPIAYLINNHFEEKVRFFVVTRQALWVGLWTAVCVWLQINRALGIAVALIALAIFASFELLLQVRARTGSILGEAG